MILDKTGFGQRLLTVKSFLWAYIAPPSAEVVFYIAVDDLFVNMKKTIDL